MARAFPLANLLRLRQMQQEMAAADLARANAARERAEQRRRDTDRMLSEAAMPAGADLLSWRAAVAARASVSALRAEATTALELRRVEAEAAGEQWSAARRVARALEILEERHVAHERKEDERVEQLALDETSLRRSPAFPAADPGEPRP